MKKNPLVFGIALTVIITGYADVCITNMTSDVFGANLRGVINNGQGFTSVARPNTRIMIPFEPDSPNPTMTIQLQEGTFGTNKFYDVDNGFFDTLQDQDSIDVTGSIGNLTIKISQWGCEYGASKKQNP